MPRLQKAPPKFPHTCDRCVFVASVRLNQWYDVYRCPYADDDGGDVLVARYGCDPQEYGSLRSGMIAGCFLAQKDETTMTPLIRAILIALVDGPFDALRGLDTP